MVNFPNAKINLGLQVTSKRVDGYHNIDSCFYPIPLQDVLEFVPAHGISMETFGMPIAGNPHDNLIWKAYHLLKSDFNLPEIAITLYKNIPMGAGLGGGSADGAFMLRLLNKYFQLKLSNTKLEQYSLQLGSDCPFFIDNQPRYVRGRGDVMQPIKIDLKGLWLGLIFPGIHIGTREAYSGLVPDSSRESVKSVIESEPIEQWKTLLINDFEASVFQKHAVLQVNKNILYDAGAIYASMTGSGSTLFGIFEKPVKSTLVDKWLQL